jgi:hypothetical protein
MIQRHVTSIQVQVQVQSVSIAGSGYYVICTVGSEVELRLSALITGSALLHRKIPGPHSCYRLILMRLEGLRKVSRKIPTEGELFCALNFDERLILKQTLGNSPQRIERNRIV